VVLNLDRRISVMHECHDQMGHKGVYTTLQGIHACFWWPQMGEDVKCYISTCHLCQL
ncbi:hypothetical protein GGU10DRAFT_232491, partial [Lentinula aff. detonsa]